ncbi:MAG: hypothetical protein AB1898_09230 [Acidobacteriota bacterium]
MNRFEFALILIVAFSAARPALGQERMVVDCEPGTETSKDVAVYSAPGGYVAIEKLRCGQEVTVLSTNQGFSRVLTANNRVGFVKVNQLRIPERIQDLAPRVERLEREVEQLKATTSAEDAQRIRRLEEDVRELQTRMTSATPGSLPGPAFPASSPVPQPIQPVPAEPSESPLPPGVLREFPRVELYGGYSYARAEGGVNLHGWNASAAGNVNSWFGIVGDVSGHYISEGPAGGSLYTVLAGPRFSFRGDAASGFLHAMVGVTRLGVGAEIFDISFSLSDTFLALAGGGGVDVRVNDRLAIRAVQADYVPVRIEGVFLHNFRVGAGLVVRF